MLLSQPKGNWACHASRDERFTMNSIKPSSCGLKWNPARTNLLEIKNIAQPRSENQRL
jgi:hypothetical protein